MSMFVKGPRIAAVLSILLCTAVAQNAGSAKGATTGTAGRGEYIANSVAVCSQCHTPRMPDGNVDPDRWLQGAPLWIMPARNYTNGPTWPYEAPRIAGTPPATDAEMVTLLTTGVWKDGSHLRPPMPQFRMSREDAEAVVAYLKSLRMKAE